MTAHHEHHEQPSGPQWRTRTKSQARRDLGDLVEDAARSGIPTVITQAVTHPQPRKQARARAVIVPVEWFLQQDHTGLRPGDPDQT